LLVAIDPADLVRVFRVLAGLGAGVALRSGPASVGSTRLAPDSIRYLGLLVAFGGGVAPQGSGLEAVDFSGPADVRFLRGPAAGDPGFHGIHLVLGALDVALVARDCFCVAQTVVTAIRRGVVFAPSAASTAAGLGYGDRRVGFRPGLACRNEDGLDSIRSRRHAVVDVHRAPDGRVVGQELGSGRERPGKIHELSLVGSVQISARLL